MTDIPSEEEFARAKRLMRSRFRGLDKVSELVKQRFKKIYPLHSFYIMPQRDVSFRAYVFFDRDEDIEACKSSGIVKEIIDAVYCELEYAERGKREEITVAFEFDSNENVARNYEGNYFLRLR